MIDIFPMLCCCFFLFLPLCCRYFASPWHLLHMFIYPSLMCCFCFPVSSFDEIRCLLLRLDCVSFTHLFSITISTNAENFSHFKIFFSTKKKKTVLIEKYRFFCQIKSNIYLFLWTRMNQTESKFYDIISLRMFKAPSIHSI